MSMIRGFCGATHAAGRRASQLKAQDYKDLIE
jgi:hypothetical protein